MAVAGASIPQTVASASSDVSSHTCLYLSKGGRLSTVNFRRKSQSICVRAFWPASGKNAFWPEAEVGELPLSENGSIAELTSISDFTRFQDKGRDGTELQTAIISYRRPRAFPLSLLQPRIQVDLVAAVHIADREYFSVMQRELDSYDCVLYEMVADKGRDSNKAIRWKPPKRSTRRKRGFSFIGSIQRLLASLLKLDFQLERMDYRKDNWYHADLDYETFKSLQVERGENFFTFARDLAQVSSNVISKAALARDDLGPWKMKLFWMSRMVPMPLLGLLLIEGVCAPSEAPLYESPEMKALLNLDFSSALKVFLARQLATDLTKGAASIVESSVIIGERNRTAMQELEKALDEGCNKVAIFYGSGHLPDMDRRLRTEFGLKPTNIFWQTAWSMNAPQRPVAYSPLATVAEITGWPLNRYQTLALALFSLVLAVDLWFWELCFNLLDGSAEKLIETIVHFLDKGWNL